MSAKTLLFRSLSLSSFELASDFEIRASDFGKLGLETAYAITRRTIEVYCLDHPPHHPRRNHPSADDPHPARIRTRSDFPARKKTRRQRTCTDFSHPGCRSNGANGFARRDHQRRAS